MRFSFRGLQIQFDSGAGRDAGDPQWINFKVSTSTVTQRTLGTLYLDSEGMSYLTLPDLP